MDASRPSHRPSGSALPLRGQADENSEPLFPLDRIESYLVIGRFMRTTKQLSITLPNHMADALKNRVSSGAYASESEVVRDGLRALFAQEEAIERWLSAEVSASYDALRADPSLAISSADVRAQLSALHEKESATQQT